ncbi:hypothetical protein DSO57_1028357 [Entomophthora muscae]|uniref:Uncharacterized protein n=1 Tax=Entomophthora muscae TaxID=34485 RepID=A0ACC2RG61_9FUNG|nr:hypothetical protein DSO57_1028357 [Entomophthora muscae]
MLSFKSALVSILLTTASCASNWRLSPVHLAPYIGRVEQSTKQQCLGFFHSRTEFFGPASCFYGKGGLDLVKFIPMDDGSLGVHDWPIDSIANDKNWNQKNPIYHNKAQARARFLINEKLSAPEYSMDHKASDFIVLRLNKNKIPVYRMFTKVNDTLCYSFHSQKYANVLPKDKFSKELFCLEEKAGAGQDVLEAKDLGAPAFVFAKAPHVIVAGIQVDTILRKGKPYYYFTKF